jgi:hypothetical protein
VDPKCVLNLNVYNKIKLNLDRREMSCFFCVRNSVKIVIDVFFLNEKDKNLSVAYVNE